MIRVGTDKPYDQKRSFPRINSPMQQSSYKEPFQRQLQEDPAPRKNGKKPNTSNHKITLKISEVNPFSNDNKFLYNPRNSKMLRPQALLVMPFNPRHEKGMVLIAKGYKLINQRNRLTQTESKKIEVERPKVQTAKPLARSQVYQRPKQLSPQRKLLKFTNNPSEKTLKYIVHPANNGDLIRTIMKTRPQWVQTSPSNTIFNFRWQPLGSRQNFQRLDGGKSGIRQIVNHFEFQDEITNKVKLIRNLKAYCDMNQLDVFSICPLTYAICSHPERRDSQIIDFLKFFIQNEPKKQGETKRLVQQYKKITGVNSLDAKKLKWINQTRPKRKQSKEIDTERQSNPNPQHNYHTQPKREKNIPLPHKEFFLSTPRFLWLLKPAGQNRGRGVQIFNNLGHLQKLLHAYVQGDLKGLKEGRKQQVSELPSFYVKSEQFVIQKYLQRPLLIKDRKFDIRVWSLLTHRMNLYIYKQGYLRTSSELFDLSKQNPFVHLTNNAIQKYSSSYGVFENGNQLSFKELQGFLVEKGMQLQPVLQQIKRVIKLTFQSVKKVINKNHRKFSFQIFGFDFMIDQSGKVWLIEVNTNPCIELSSKLLEALIPAMLEEALQLTVDQIFPSGSQPDKRGAGGWQMLDCLSCKQKKK